MSKFYLFIVFFTASTVLSAQSNDLKLNHFYVVLDSMTFEKIKQSDELKSIVNLDEGLPDFNPIEQSTSTIYLRGKQTYVELMGPNNKFKKKIGALGIGFSWDSENRRDTILSQKFRVKDSLSFNKFEARKEINHKKTDWYIAFYTNFKGNIGTWYAFYHPAFISELNQKRYDAFRREYYLERAYNKEKDIVNISELDITCSQQDYDKIIRELSLFLIDSRRTKGNTTTFYVDGIKINLQLSTDDQSRLNSFTFRTKNNPLVSLQLGNLKLDSRDNEILFSIENNKQ